MFESGIVMPLASLDSTPSGSGPATGQALEAGGVTTTAPAAGGQIVATTTSQPSAPIKEAPASSPFGGLLQMAPIVLMLVALYFFMMRGQKKEEKRRKSLLLEMKKGDKVQTIGGLVARVVSIDGDEVVLKVDESANVKATYKKSAIMNVIVAGDEKTK